MRTRDPQPRHRRRNLCCGISQNPAQVPRSCGAGFLVRARPGTLFEGRGAAGDRDGVCRYADLCVPQRAAVRRLGHLDARTLRARAFVRRLRVRRLRQLAAARLQCHGSPPAYRAQGAHDPAQTGPDRGMNPRPVQPDSLPIRIRVPITSNRPHATLQTTTTPAR